MSDAADLSDFESALADEASTAQADGLQHAPDILDLGDGKAALAALTEPRPLKIFDSWFVLERNDGGGDCLFLALAGDGLDDAALRALRSNVAERRLIMPEDRRGNARRVVAALLQTPWAQARGKALMQQGVRGLSNRTCAALQAVPRIYVGEDEIEQWCGLTGRTVCVIDADGTLRRISQAGVTDVGVEPKSLRQTVQWLIESGDLALFKTPGHWRRIVALRPV